MAILPENVSPFHFRERQPNKLIVAFSTDSSNELSSVESDCSKSKERSARYEQIFLGPCEVEHFRTCRSQLLFRLFRDPQENSPHVASCRGLGEPQLAKPLRNSLFVLTRCVIHPCRTQRPCRNQWPGISWSLTCAFSLRLGWAPSFRDVFRFCEQLANSRRRLHTRCSQLEAQQVRRCGSLFFPQ